MSNPTATAPIAPLSPPPYVAPHKALVFVRTWQLHQWAFVIILIYLTNWSAKAIAPFCRPFDLQDPSINYAFSRSERVTPAMLTYITCCSVLFLFFPVIIFVRSTTRFCWQELNHWALYIVMSCALSFCCTNAMKLFGGRYRPDFVDRLRMSGFVVDVSVIDTDIAPPLVAGAVLATKLVPQFALGFTAETFCEYQYLQEKAFIREGHLSFPSGHSTSVFSNMIPVLIFILSRVRPFHHTCFARLFLCVLGPFSLCSYVILSRAADNRHNYSDTIGGSLVGIFAGCVTLPLFFTYVRRHDTWALKVPVSCYNQYVVDCVFSSVMQKTSCNTNAAADAVVDIPPIGCNDERLDRVPEDWRAESAVRKGRRFVRSPRFFFPSSFSFFSTFHCQSSSRLRN